MPSSEPDRATSSRGDNSEDAFRLQLLEEQVAILKQEVAELRDKVESLTRA